MVLYLGLSILIPIIRVYGRDFLRAVGVISIRPQKEMKAHPASSGETCDQHVIDFLNQDYRYNQ